MTSRIVLIFVMLLSVWGLLIMRAVALQIFPNARLENLKSRQFQTTITLQNRRGAISDRQGRDLAVSMKAASVYADPMLIENKKQTARKLAKILDLDPKDVLSRIKDSKKRFVWLSRFLPIEKGDAIKSLDIRGLQVVQEFKRVYPNDDLLGNVLGFVGIDGKGLEGAELQLDEILAGSKRQIVVRRDARGRPLVNEGMMFTENIEGAEVRLTIDSELQFQLEKELKNAMQVHKAVSAYGLILDAKTSAVLSMANFPNYNPNFPKASLMEARRNRTVTDAFEPGSTLKTFVVGAALKEGIIAPNTKYNTENGIFKIGDRVIREADEKHKWKSLTVSEILSLSSNIGVTKIAFDLGAQSLHHHMQEFGFGNKTNIDLPGESRGILQNLPWNMHLTSNVSFGHGITVTPLQLANAYATIANGGSLNQPYIVDAIKNQKTGEFEKTEPQKIRQVLDPQIAASLRMILTGVTADGGTGVNAKVDGFLVAGKTGTAQKVDAKNGGYLKDGYISSFAGFIPANDPKFVIFIVIDQPQDKNYYGSQVAAPIFSRLASYAVRKEGLAPVVLSQKNLPVKDKPTKAKNESSLARLQLIEDLQFDSSQKVPLLESLSSREVLRKLSPLGVEVKFKGSGRVVETIPVAGQDWGEKKTLTVILQ